MRWLCFDAAAIGDVDYTAAAVLAQIVQREQKAGMRVVMSNVGDAVRAELDRYGIAALIGPDGFLRDVRRGLAEYLATPGVTGPRTRGRRTRGRGGGTGALAQRHSRIPTTTPAIVNEGGDVARGDLDDRDRRAAAEIAHPVPNNTAPGTTPGWIRPGVRRTRRIEERHRR